MELEILSILFACECFNEFVPNDHKPMKITIQKPIWMVFSDNWPEYTSTEYRKFTASQDLHHDTSSPEYVQSNGMVETTIQTVKKESIKVLKKKERQIYCTSHTTYPIYPTPPLGQDMTQGQFLSGV